MKIFIITSFIYFCNSAAADVLVTPAFPTSREGLNQLVKELPKEIESQSLFEKLLLEPLTSDQQNSLFKQMSQAEEEALKKNFEGAIKIYESLLKRLEQHPNINGLNKLTLTTLIKLGELYKLSNDIEKSSAFFKKAKAWDVSAELDQEVFSPSTQQVFKKIKLGKSFTVDIKYPAHAMAFLNGKKLMLSSAQKTVQIFEGKHQLAVLSPGELWQVKNFYIHKDSSKKISIESKIIAGGTCDKPYLQADNLPAYSKLIVMMDSCQRVFDGSQWYTMQGEALSHAPAEQILSETFTYTKEKGPWLSEVIKSPWFWGAVGAVGVLVFIKSQEQPTVIVPTHSYR